MRVVPTVPYANEDNFQKQAGRYAATLDNAIWANQFDNTANALSHYESTGPEIWAQTDGKVDVFTCAVGTGGTLAGTSAYLKEQNPNMQIILADPMGSALYNWVSTGEATMTPGPSITEGIGNSQHHGKPKTGSNRQRGTSNRPRNGGHGLPTAARRRLVLWF